MADPDRRTRLSPLDQDYCAVLEREHEILAEIVHLTMKYRHIVRLGLTHLRMGAESGGVRASVERWVTVRRGLKRLAREL